MGGGEGRGFGGGNTHRSHQLRQGLVVAKRLCDDHGTDDEHGLTHGSANWQLLVPGGGVGGGGVGGAGGGGERRRGHIVRRQPPLDPARL